MSFRTKFKAALTAGSRNAIIKALAEHPNATVAELRKLSQADSNLAKQFKAITIADLFKDTGVVTGTNKGVDKSTRERTLSIQGGQEVDTRTPEGRAAYDKLLFGVVKGAKGPIGAAAIIAAAGGTPLQARTGLARLIEDGKITWTGKARGTKYEAL